MFFARNDEEQNELPAASHQQWTRQMWKTNGVFCKRNVHVARAGRAQELAIDGTYRAEIAELGHWAINKMTRAYITAISVGVVMKKVGYSGAKQDYFLGRSRVPPFDELLELIAKHIFPRVDDLLKKNWAKRVEKIDTKTIKKRRDPTLIQPEEISIRMDAKHAVMSLTETLKYERERSAVQKIDLEEDIEKHDATIAMLTAEITRLTEPGKGVKGLGKREVSKLRVACAFMARGLKPEKWVAKLFADTWKEQIKMTLADMAWEDAVQLPSTKTSTKRKKTT
ncbi:unnamed protein product [Closterium sp. NIES-64]|nr:unnamed protein product [Closterium sp. NIES-64]